MNAEEKKKALEIEMENNFHKHECKNIEGSQNEESQQIPKLSLKEILQEIETEKRNLKQTMANEARKKELMRQKGSS